MNQELLYLFNRVFRTCNLHMQNFAWRKEHDMDNILNEDFTEWEKRHPFYFSTYDHEGRPGSCHAKTCSFLYALPAAYL
jgi:hypothetical protein